jgi:hypothetical protein
MLTPAFTYANQLPTVLRQQGYAVLSPAGVCELARCSPDQLHGLEAGWDDLPADAYLKDGGRYRRRRHACFVVDGADVRAVAQRPHWQPLEYNALHGGMQRWFEPMLAHAVQAPVWPLLLRALGEVTSQLRGPQPWHVEAHQFRIDTTDGIGRPTPEGAHRDGVDLVAVFLVARVGVKGGESRVFEAHGPNGRRFTLTEPWSLLLLDDERVIHESTPIQPEDGPAGHRDTLVLTYRAGDFQQA